ncbi:histidine phosphatase family protein [Streptomyces piniterrae]|uniref:Histidine phosphatase family protein n=1 Tax=Streptomyces piniterrae TaxID=2571125 RepID=A0A4U0MUF2_9ACTN|nr:histidine phosphatase family protein [Streptomyces piniterrae]TJZ44553.1 histidine phosphatase family protein [Streptomyces piniterrae]
MSSLRRLVVLRHAKSARPPDVADHERPLAPRGRRDAPAAGRWLRDADWLPELVLCSTSQRTRETWDLAAAQLGTPPPARYEPALYAATVPELLTAVREVPAHVHTLLLIGHNPSTQDLVLTLAGDGLGDALPRTQESFPTSAIAVLTWYGTWQAIEPGKALLTEMVVPRGKK